MRGFRCFAMGSGTWKIGGTEDLWEVGLQTDVNRVSREWVKRQRLSPRGMHRDGTERAGINWSKQGHRASYPWTGDLLRTKKLTLHFEAIAPLENFARSFSGHWFRRKSLLVISLPYSQTSSLLLISAWLFSLVSPTSPQPSLGHTVLSVCTQRELYSFHFLSRLTLSLRKAKMEMRLHGAWYVSYWSLY